MENIEGKTNKMESIDGEENEDIYINSTDGLPCEHPVIPEGDVDEPEIDEESFDDLPTSIIVTNIHPDVFASEDLKRDLENLFKDFGSVTTFQWLKSFKRLRYVRFFFLSSITSLTWHLLLLQSQLR